MVKIAIVGHVDNGKSSLLSRILFPESKGDPYMLDFLQEEKDRGITQEYSVHTLENLTFIDTAGHKSFIRTNIKAYTSIHIHVALIVCSLRKGEFSAGFQTKCNASATTISPLKEQLLLLRSTGVKDAVIVLTKVDLGLLENEQKVLKAVKSFLKEIGMKCTFTARVSAKTGEGIPSLLDYLRGINVLDESIIKPPNVASSTVEGEFVVLFIPKGKVITAGSFFVAHFCGEEVECTLDYVESISPILKMGMKYKARFIFSREINLFSRIILRMCDCTVGFCKVSI